MREFTYSYTDVNGKLVIMPNPEGWDADTVATVAGSRRLWQEDRGLDRDARVITRDSPDGSWTVVTRHGTCGTCGTATPLTTEMFPEPHTKPGATDWCPGSARYPSSVLPIQVGV